MSGLTQAQVAAEIGQSREWVNKYLSKDKRTIGTGTNSPPTDTDCRRKLPKRADAQIVEAVPANSRRRFGNDAPFPTASEHNTR